MLMIRFALFFVLFSELSFAQVQEGRTESQTGLLVVYGGNFKLRAALTQDGEALVEALNSITEPMKGEPNPIVIELQKPVRGKESAIARRLFPIPENQGGGFRLQVDVRLGRGFVYVQKELNRVLLEMILIERTLRGRGEDEVVDQVEIRPWLLDGIQEAIAWRDHRGDRRVYVSLAQTGGWLEVEKLVEAAQVSEMDALARELFRASSGALVMALLEQSNGKAAMASYLRESAIHQGEALSLVRQHFPEVNLGRKGLEKWWALSVAKMAEKPLSEAMTIAETEERLDKILQLHLKDEKGKVVVRPLEAWVEMADLVIAERAEVVRPTLNLLTSLSYRCFPTYREVVGGYMKVLGDMAAGNPDDIDDALGNLAEFRRAEVRRMSQLEDLMDWFHLSTVDQESGEFDDYLKLKEKLREHEPSQDDPVTHYVDQMQKIFEKQKSISPSAESR